MFFSRNSPDKGFVPELDTKAMDIFTKRNLEMVVYIPGEETIKRSINEGQETVFDFIINREKQRNVDYLLNQMQQQLDKWRKGMAGD